MPTVKKRKGRSLTCYRDSGTKERTVEKTEGERAAQLLVKDKTSYFTVERTHEHTPARDHPTVYR